MSDVSAVVLTMGEPTTSGALASLAAQTLPVEDVILVDRVQPFHRAFNFGADRVKTSFFVQVDSDFVLDADCTSALREAMGAKVGVAVGALRDPLMGTVAGVKMFQRRIFDSCRLRNTVAPDVDFNLALGRKGWLTRCVVVPGQGGSAANTLGAHRPEYTVEYVFGTYYLLGARYAYLDDLGGLGWRFRQLRRSTHPMAPVARLAMGHGVFAAETRDVCKPRPSAADSPFLQTLTTCSAAPSFASADIRRALSLAPAQLFNVCRDLGAALRASSPTGLASCLGQLGATAHPRSILGEIALGHGVLAKSWPDPVNVLGPLERLAADDGPASSPLAA